MEINTRDFGNICVEEDAVFDFPKGIYGFEDSTQFAVFENKISDISFLYLQSTQQEIPCFLVFEPWDLVPNFSPTLSPEDMKICEVEDIEDLIFLAIANIPNDNVRALSLNIKSPIVLNPTTKTGYQVILQNSDYKIRFQPFLAQNFPSEDGTNKVDRKDGSSC